MGPGAAGPSGSRPEPLPYFPTATKQPRPDQAAGPNAAMISRSAGKAPVWRLDQRRVPSTVISNTPPPDLCRVTAASGLREAIKVRAARARAS